MRAARRLVGRAIFAQAYGVMREDINSALTHKRRHAHGVSRVFHEDQEGATEGNESAVQRDAVHHGRHGKLTDTIVDVITFSIGGVSTFGFGPQS